MFSWDDKPSAYPRAAVRRREMFKKEVEDRAGLLLRLGHKAADVKARLQKSVAWDFDHSPRPDHLGEVDRIVDEVYKRNQK